MIIDSHCHLDFPELYDQLDQIIERADLNNVKHLMTISTTLDSFKKIELIVKKYKNIYGTLGIHPHESKNFTYISSQEIKNLYNNNKKIIGIGETGLDFYYKNSEKSLQKKLFIEHIDAAIDLDLPVIVHTRNAEKDTIDINDFLSKVASLLIHAAKIDQDYTNDEKEIIKKTLIKLGAKNSNIDKIISDATINEENSNQILNFTKKIKNTSELDKIKIIEALWEIIYSSKDADIYETNLMQRLTGLLYIDHKIMGDIKEKIKKKFLK